jgi:hypothetical protein
MNDNEREQRMLFNIANSIIRHQRIRARKRKISNYRLQYKIACSLHANYYARMQRKHELFKI